jgi:hypothetical protein
VTEVNRVTRRYAHDGKLVDLLAGLHTAITRIDAVLGRYAPPEPQAADPAGSPELIDAILGVIAIRDRLTATMTAATTHHDAEAPLARPPQESLLR